VISHVRILLTHLSSARESHTPAGDQVRVGFQKWLSPPDPSINYNTAREIYHDGTATWFTQGETYRRWKSPGSGSFLWIHGKGLSLLLLAPYMLLISSSGVVAGSGKSILR
jgi:hypothetical protein